MVFELDIEAVDKDEIRDLLAVPEKGIEGVDASSEEASYTSPPVSLCVGTASECSTST
jgi:hypothetical protein